MGWRISYNMLFNPLNAFVCHWQSSSLLPLVPSVGFVQYFSSWLWLFRPWSHSNQRHFLLSFSTASPLYMLSFERLSLLFSSVVLLGFLKPEIWKHTLGSTKHTQKQSCIIILVRKEYKEYNSYPSKGVVSPHTGKLISCH